MLFGLLGGKKPKDTYYAFKEKKDRQKRWLFLRSKTTFEAYEVDSSQAENWKGPVITIDKKTTTKK